MGGVNLASWDQQVFDPNNGERGGESIMAHIAMMRAFNRHNKPSDRAAISIYIGTVISAVKQSPAAVGYTPAWSTWDIG